MSCLLHQNQVPLATPPLPEQALTDNLSATNDWGSFLTRVPDDDFNENCFVSFLGQLYNQLGTTNGLKFLLANYPEQLSKQNVIERCHFLELITDQTALATLKEVLYSQSASEGEQILAFKLLVAVLQSSPSDMGNFLLEYLPILAQKGESFYGRWLNYLTPETIAALDTPTIALILQKIKENKTLNPGQWFSQKITAARKIQLPADYLSQFVYKDMDEEQGQALLDKITPNALPNFLPKLIKYNLLAQAPFPVTVKTFGCFFDRASFFGDIDAPDWEIVLNYLEQPEQENLRRLLVEELLDPHSQHAPTFETLAKKPVFNFLLKHAHSAANCRQLNEILKRKSPLLSTRQIVLLLSSQCLKNSGQTKKGLERERLYLRDLGISSPVFLAKNQLTPQNLRLDSRRAAGLGRNYVPELRQIIKDDLRQNGITHLSPEHLEEVIDWGFYAQDQELIELCPRPRSYTKNLLFNVFNNLRIQPKFLQFMQQEMTAELTAAKQQGTLPPENSLCSLFFSHLAKQEYYQPEFQAVAEQFIPELLHLPNHPVYLTVIGKFGTPDSLPELRQKISTGQTFNFGNLSFPLQEEKAVEAYYRIKKRFSKK